MKIAITGATGGLGRYLVPMLQPDGECHLLGRSRERLLSFFEETEMIRLVETDYSENSLIPALDGVEALVHLAGIRPGGSKHEAGLYLENMRVTVNLFEACRSMNLRNVVFASSASVYTPGIDTVPFKEGEPVFPASLYAAGKLAAEKLGLPFGLHLKSLRIASVIGLGERPEYFRMAYIYRVLRKEPLHIYGDGRGEREYVYAKDVARAIRLALDKPELSAVMNVGSGKSISQYAYANLVNQVLADGKSDIVLMPEKPGFKDVHRMSIQKAEVMLGYKPEFSLEKALRDLKTELSNENSFQ